MTVIKYSAKDGTLGALSDITPATVVLKIKNTKGKNEPIVFSNAMAAYAYLCSDDEERKEKLRNTLNIKTLNFLASARSGFTEPESRKQRIKLKRRVLRAKFVNGHPYFSKILLETQDSDLIEHRYWESSDSFWGEAKDGSGRNEHGKILMEIREELRIKFNITPKSNKDSEDGEDKKTTKSKSVKKTKKSKSSKDKPPKHDLPFEWDEDEPSNKSQPKKKKKKKATK